MFDDSVDVFRLCDWMLWSCLGFTMLLVLNNDDGPLLMCAYSDWKSTPKSHNLVSVAGGIDMS